LSINNNNNFIWFIRHCPSVYLILFLRRSRRAVFLF